jgi:hypothetical protein
VIFLSILNYGRPVHPKPCVTAGNFFVVCKCTAVTTGRTSLSTSPPQEHRCKSPAMPRSTFEGWRILLVGNVIASTMSASMMPSLGLKIIILPTWKDSAYNPSRYDASGQHATVNNQTQIQSPILYHANQTSTSRKQLLGLVTSRLGLLILPRLR